MSCRKKIKKDSVQREISVKSASEEDYLKFRI